MKTILAALLVAASAAAAAQTPQASIRIDPARVENRISPRMYASFVEMMAEDVKWGLTAEMIHDRSFEAAPDYLGLPADWRLEPDTRNDNVGAIRFAQTTAEAYPKTGAVDNVPEHSLVVTLNPEDITDTRRGFSEGRLSIRAGEAYNGYVWIKLPETNPYTGPITVALEEDATDGAHYATATLPALSAGPWRKYAFTLTPAATDRFAKLSFLFDGKGALFLDQVSLEPASAREEVRADSEAMIAGLHPSFMRWPGGNVAQDYHWQWGVGPRDGRPTWTNKAWSNAPEPNDLGTDEYLALCAREHIEPSITVNVNGNGATPEEAAAWVEYVNGPATSKYGAMRAANGHPAPYGVKQWELGNEIFGAWVRGHVPAEVYAASAVQYARAMRAVDPSIKLIAVGEGIMPERDAWNSAVLRIAGGDIDYLAIHDYTAKSKNTSAPNPRAAMMARAAEFEAGYRHTAALIAELAPSRPIKQIVNEWNLFYDAGTIQSMEGAVWAARMMNGFERDGDAVEANCISDLLNGWVGGVIQASRDRIYGTAQYYALAMYNAHLGSERLHTEVRSPELAPGVPSLDAIATRAPDGARLFVKMSNADNKQPVSVDIDPGLAYTSTVEETLLASPSPGPGCDPNQMPRNSFADPHTLAPTERSLTCSKVCTVQLPPDSVAVLTFHLRASER